MNSVTEGIDALASTRVVIRPSGKISNEGFSDNPQNGQKQRTFSGGLGAG